MKELDEKELSAPEEVLRDEEAITPSEESVGPVSSAKDSTPAEESVGPERSAEDCAPAAGNVGPERSAEGGAPAEESVGPVSSAEDSAPAEEAGSTENPVEESTPAAESSSIEGSAGTAEPGLPLTVFSSHIFSGFRSHLMILLPALILALLLFLLLSGGPDRPDPEDEKVDRTPPAIMLTRDNRYFVEPGEQYEEEGYAAYDNLDGDLTKKVEVTILEDVVRYRVSDNAGNVTVRFRRIPYAKPGSTEED